MFNLTENLVKLVESRAEALEKSVCIEDEEIVYASLGCTTCEVFTQ